MSKYTNTETLWNLGTLYECSNKNVCQQQGRSSGNQMYKVPFFFTKYFSHSITIPIVAFTVIVVRSVHKCSTYLYTRQFKVTCCVVGFIYKEHEESIVEYNKY